MNNDWIKTSAAKQAIGYYYDSRPVWLYSTLDAKLLWCNPAAHLLNAKQKNNILLLAPLTLSLKTQAEHILKLTPVGRSSLARIRFGSKNNQIFLTCTCTSLDLNNNEKSLLIIGVDKIKKTMMKKYANSEQISKHLFSPDIGFIMLDKNKHQPLAGTNTELEKFNQLGLSFLTPNDDDILEFQITENATLTLFLNSKQEKKISSQREKLPNLTSLLDTQIKTKITAPTITAPTTQFTSTDKNIPTKEIKEQTILWQVRGKGFEKQKSDLEQAQIPKQATGGQKTASYNFEELSRILLKKTSKEKDSSKIDLKKEEIKPTIIKKLPILEKAQEPVPEIISTSTSLIKLPQETLILNRLPLGLLIFSNQKILFANREMIKLTGFNDLADLRNSGLASIFPSSKSTKEDQTAGPITHLLKQDGMQVAVKARLQVITWQGKSAFLLSANRQETNEAQSPTNNVQNTINSVREFASNLAQLETSGFFTTDRSAKITAIDDKSATMLNFKTSELIDNPLGKIIKPDNLVDLRFFLEQNAKTAQSKQPAILLKTVDPNIEILFFSEGRAGIVKSYFGLIREVKISSPIHKTHFSGIDPQILERLSRSMRRPLNTIIGFSELLSSHSFELSSNKRYDEYAADIKTAGHELLSVIDDLETITKLKDKQYKPAQIDFDLTNLIEKCLFRTRPMASEAQVLIRSAISQLGRIKADEASLEQAVLNLIASAIGQTPRGEQVVISAKKETNGSITVHVRDSSHISENESDDFMVFRDEKTANAAIKTPIISSIGLSLTRSLLAINTCTLVIEPSASEGTLFSLNIPASLTS